MLTTLVLSAALVTAQPGLASHPSDAPIARHLEQTVFEPAPAAFALRYTQTGSRDSRKNGAAVGAVVGGAITGLGIGWLCHAFNDSDFPCWQPVLLWTALGAGAGALVGAGVDALVQRRISVRGTVTF